MRLVKWDYVRWSRIKAVFNTHPASPVVFGKVNQFYIVFRVLWDESDQEVSREDLLNMELLINEELGSLSEYKNRKSVK
ncbi:hypothetical protein [Alkalihalobacillus deserti]|uniref:hypothetical protein n=1 Tax=Alkalihalobacillus deserti TaxID=2879466 RepID=UPI001D14BA3C|nr:hypothetical protein [Alkalihalobacillus deserti]